MISKTKKNILIEHLYTKFDFNSCPFKNNGCSKIVPGEGNLDSKILFIGEAPGKTEDQLGRPFVGRSGKLLSEYLQKAGITRENVYITNIVKCRPPNNRKPSTKEISYFKPILFEEIKIINPKMICTLGASAFSGLTNQNIPMAQVRGKPIPTSEGITIIPTFHPAYILRNPAAGKEFLADLKKALNLANQKKAIKPAATKP